MENCWCTRLPARIRETISGSCRCRAQRTPTKYLDGPSEERHAQFSPDGRRIAYSSDESGQFQIYVQTVPATGDKRQISTQGGSRPRWRRDGKELYYLSADGKLMAVPVKLGAERWRSALPSGSSICHWPAGGNRAFLYAPCGERAEVSGVGSDRWHDGARHDLDELDGRHRQVARVCRPLTTARQDT